MKIQNQMMIGSAELTSRGWTAARIKQVLGAPDVVQGWTTGRTRVVRHLWSLARIEAAESSFDWQVWLAKSKARRETALKAADKRRQETLKYVRNLKIEIPKMTESHLIRKATENYNDVHSGSDKYASVGETLADDFVARICVNYLRHMLTSYEYQLRQLHGKTGIDEAVDLLRERIYDKIGRTYPDLEVECTRQLGERLERVR